MVYHIKKKKKLDDGRDKNLSFLLIKKTY